MNKLKILVIDDDPFVLKSCKRVLESEDYLVTLCLSIQEAVKFLEEERFQLIIKDVVMPGSIEVDIDLKIREEQDEVKILTMSGYMAPVLFSELINREDTSFLSKPFTPEELLDAVKEAVSKNYG